MASRTIRHWMFLWLLLWLPTLSGAKEVVILFDLSSSTLPSAPNPLSLMREINQALAALLGDEPINAQLWRVDGRVEEDDWRTPIERLVLIGFGGVNVADCRERYPQSVIDSPAANLRSTVSDFFFSRFRAALSTHTHLREGLELPDLAKWQGWQAMRQEVAAPPQGVYWQLVVSDGVHFDRGPCGADPELADRQRRWRASAAEEPQLTLSYRGRFPNSANLRIELSQVRPLGAVSCAAGEELVNGQCQRCPAGAILQEGRCVACEEGFSPDEEGVTCLCPSQNVDGRGRCLPCSVGFTLNGAGQCVPFLSLLDPSIIDELPSIEEVNALRQGDSTPRREEDERPSALPPAIAADSVEARPQPDRQRLYNYLLMALLVGAVVIGIIKFK